MTSSTPLAIPESVQEANRTFLETRRALTLDIVSRRPGLEVAEALSACTDRWLRTLWATAVEAPSSQSVSLLATGGYGRRELAWHSDIDVLIAVHDPNLVDDDRFSLAIERLMAWSRQTRMRLSQVVRTATQARRAIDDDLRNAIALLDLRHLAGPDVEDTAFERAAVLNTLRDTDEGRAFVASLVDGMRRRIARQGQTVFLLEPDIKNGEGGLRDLNYLAWAAQTRWCLDVRHNAAPDRGWSPALRDDYHQRLSDLLAIRNQLHLLRGRKHDRLTFREQEALIRLRDLGPLQSIDEALQAIEQANSHAEAPATRQDPASLHPSIESMMAAYYRRARSISITTERMLRRWMSEANAPTNRDGPFELGNGHLALAHAQSLGDREVFEALAVADERDLLLDPRLETAIEARVAQWPCGDEIPSFIARRTRDLLVDIDSQPRTSRRLLELGILACVVPEFSPLICHVQHDLYHVYTTDVHSLKCLEAGRSLLSAKPADLAHPGFVHIAHHIDNSTVFLLACLFHDIGKARGGRHSERGAELMKQVAPRLGLVNADTQALVSLVRHHLILSTTSRRRDISDPEIIASLADTIGSVARLNQLTALTYCDMTTVGPDVMNDWNASLLLELHHRLKSALETVSETTPQPDKLRESKRQALKNELAAQPELDDRRLDAFIDDLPLDHLGDADPLALRFQYQTYCRCLEADDNVAVTLRNLPDRGVTEIIVTTIDTPGTLARIAGAIASAGINIMGADIVTTASGLALDIFHVAHFNPRAMPPTKPRPVDAPRRMERLHDRIGDVLRERVDVDALLLKRRDEQRLKPRPVPAVETEIRIDHQSSTRFTIIEVRAPDQLGLLYRIARTLVNCRVNTRVSRIDSLGHQAIDTFYVEEWDGSPLDEKRTQEIVEALRRALEAMERRDQTPTDTPPE